MQVLLRCHHGGAERGSPNVWMEEKAPERILDWLSQKCLQPGLPHLLGSTGFCKLGSECCGSRGSLEGFPEPFQAAWCDTAFRCVI